MFFDSLHAVGGVAVADTPLIRGPRHCGQNWSAPFCAAKSGSNRHRATSASDSGSRGLAVMWVI